MESKNFDREYEAVTVVQGEVQRYRVSREERALEERTFVIGGETFGYRLSVAPEAILKWSQATGGEFVPTEEEWLAIYDQTIGAFLLPGQEETWAKVRAVDAPNPLNLTDLASLVRWLLEQQTGRPTQPQSSSSNGSGDPTIGTQLTEESDLPVAPA